MMCMTADRHCPASMGPGSPSASTCRPVALSFSPSSCFMKGRQAWIRDTSTRVSRAASEPTPYTRAYTQARDFQ